MRDNPLAYSRLMPALLLPLALGVALPQRISLVPNRLTGHLVNSWPHHAAGLRVPNGPRLTTDGAISNLAGITRHKMANGPTLTVSLRLILARNIPRQDGTLVLQGDRIPLRKYYGVWIISPELTGVLLRCQDGLLVPVLDIRGIDMAITALQQWKAQVQANAQTLDKEFQGENDGRIGGGWGGRYITYMYDHPNMDPDTVFNEVETRLQAAAKLLVAVPSTIASVVNDAGKGASAVEKGCRRY